MKKVNYLKFNIIYESVILNYVFNYSEDKYKHFEEFTIKQISEPFDEITFLKFSKLNHSTLLYKGNNYKTLLDRLNNIPLDKYEFIRSLFIDTIINLNLETQKVDSDYGGAYLLRAELKESSYFDHITLLSLFTNHYNEIARNKK